MVHFLHLNYVETHASMGLIVFIVYGLYDLYDVYGTVHAALSLYYVANQS